MPDKPLRPCAKHGCGELTRSKYCQKHTETVKEADRHKLSARQRGYTSKWERYRKVYLAQPENALCALRLDSRCAIKAQCIDHIIPHNGNYKLFWDEKNHQPACISCNSVKGQRTITGAGIQKAGRKSDNHLHPEKVP